jgi:hypothetical protein
VVLATPFKQVHVCCPSRQLISQETPRAQTACEQNVGTAACLFYMHIWHMQQQHTTGMPNPDALWWHWLAATYAEQASLQMEQGLSTHA